MSFDERMNCEQSQVAKKAPTRFQERRQNRDARRTSRPPHQARQRSAHKPRSRHALIVDALDEVAAKFYAHHGFAVFPENALALFLPLATVRNSLAGVLA